MKDSTLHTVAMVLVVVGALNWGVMGLMPEVNLVESVLGGPDSMLVRLVYLLVGVAGVLLLWTWYNGTSKRKK